MFHRSLFRSDDLDSKSVVLFLDNFDSGSVVLLDNFNSGLVCHLCHVLIRAWLLLVFVPSSVTVCASFNAQWGTAGNGTSSGHKLFSKTDCGGSYLLTELSRVRVSHPSVVMNHTTHRLSKLLSENFDITLRYTMPVGIVVSGPIAGRLRIILCP